MILNQIKKELNEFEIFKCEMYHEKVKTNSITKLPIKKCVDGKDVFIRVKLCNINLRQKRLGCAHSSVNLRFNALLDKIKVDTNKVNKIKIKFNQTINNIYLLDHKKGNLEKEYANLLLRNNIDLNKKHNLQNKIEDCVLIHNNYLNTLSLLKVELIKIINQNILKE
ncbi:hypothetical protein MPF13_10670 [Polaribacter sp. Z022]|nr:hypothetical protein [Polaribacter sp. Z022]